MKNLITVIIIIIAIIGIGAYVLNRSGIEMEQDRTITNNSKETVSNKEVMDGSEEITEEKSQILGIGSYETYSPEKLAKAEIGNVVLFFRASWCPTCRALDADIRANLENIPSNLTILDVNYDNSTELKQKYGVTYQHTLVQVDTHGNQIKKWAGSQTLEELTAQTI